MDNLCDLELEQIILSSCIQSERYLDVSEILFEKHFTKESHKAIWKTLKLLEEKNFEISAEIVAVELTKTIPEHLGALKIILQKTPMPILTILAIELIEWFNKRELYKLSLQIQESLIDKKSSSLIIQDMEQKTINLDVGIGTRAKSLREWVREYDLAPPFEIYKTNISFIDDFSQGLTVGQLILVMGDPEAGKTILVMQILRNITSQKKLALGFMFEFTIGALIKQDREKKRKVEMDFIHLINDGFTLADVSREIKIWVKKGCRIFGIDSQMRVENSENTGTVEQSESEKFSKLAKLAHTLNILIFFITQQGKEDTKGGTHTPMGTKKGAHEANQIWYIHKLKPKFDEEGNDLNKELRYFEVSKNKQNGRHFKTEIRLDPIKLEFVRKYTHQETTFAGENKKENFIKNVDGPNGKKIPVYQDQVEIPEIL